MGIPRIGDQIEQFRLVESIGRGAWIGERTQDFRQKVLIEIASGTSPQTNLQIQARIRLLANVHHICVPALLQTGTLDDERPFAIFELPEGTPLATLLNKKRLSVRGAIQLVLECLNGLAAAHRQLAAHGALEHGSILIDDAGHARLPVFPLEDSRPDPVRDDMRQIGEILTKLVREAGDKIPPDLRKVLARCSSEAGRAPYESCDKLAEDLARFLDHRAIIGTSRFGVHRVALFARRKPGVFYPFAFSAMALLLALSWSLWMEHVARQSQREEESRLRDLHRLTASLESNLYQSVRQIPHSEAAQQNLIRWTAESLDRLAANAEEDPAFRRELAGDYARLEQACRENGMGDEAARLHGKEMAVSTPASTNR